MTPPSGLILLDKPSGPSSHDLVARVRRTFGIRRVGHAGTLDPFASGLLLVLLGPATRLSEYLLGLDKVYEATARLGLETDTHDREGEVVREDPAWRMVDTVRVQGVLDAFRGVIRQRPPRYSAKKVRGEAAHRRVRRGEEVELEPVEVEIAELALVALRSPEMVFRVRCSSGTYVRALARDLGRALGVGAHLTELRRTGIGSFTVEESMTPDALEADPSPEARVISPARALGHLPAVEVEPGEASHLRQGRGVPRGDPSLPDGAPVRILLRGDLLAVGYREGAELRPRKVLAHD